MFSSSSQIEGTVCGTFPILISPLSGTLIKGGSGYVTIHSNIGFLILQLGTSRNDIVDYLEVMMRGPDNV